MKRLILSLLLCGGVAGAAGYADVQTILQNPQQAAPLDHWVGQSEDLSTNIDGWSFKDASGKQFNVFQPQKSSAWKVTLSDAFKAADLTFGQQLLVTFTNENDSTIRVSRVTDGALKDAFLVTSAYGSSLQYAAIMTSEFNQTMVAHAGYLDSDRWQFVEDALLYMYLTKKDTLCATKGAKCE